MSYDKPFAGLKVVDLSQGVAGPYAASMLAQYGADVLKVEPTGPDGDWSRGLGTRYGDQTAYSIAANLGKRSIALDLKQDDGRAVLWRLVRGADVFIQGFRPGVIDRLGFGDRHVAEREQRIIYLSVSGFGQTGPLAERPAMDPVLQAYTGLALENKGGDGLPHRIPIIAIDMSTALYGYAAVATALFARQTEARGRHIEASLLQAAAGLQGVRMMSSYLDGGVTPPTLPPSAQQLHRFPATPAGRGLWRRGVARASRRAAKPAGRQPDRGGAPGERPTRGTRAGLGGAQRRHSAGARVRGRRDRPLAGSGRGAGTVVSTIRQSSVMTRPGERPL